MALSRVTIPGDGVTTVFPVSFALGVINENDVTARVGDEVNGIGQPVYRTITFNSPELLQISGPPAGDGVPVVFERTIVLDELLVDYVDGDIINDDNLNTAQKQALMLIHELKDGRFSTLSRNLDMGQNRIINLADPVDDQDATNKRWVLGQLTGAGIGVPIDNSVTTNKIAAGAVTYEKLASSVKMYYEPTLHTGDDPIVIIATGQSNMLAVTQGNGGDRSTEPGVYVWDQNFSGTHVKGWHEAGPDSPNWPWRGGNTNAGIFYSFARRIRRETNREVRLIMHAAGGQPIANWVPGGSMWIGLLASIRDAAASPELAYRATVPLADYLLFHQGEADADYTGTTGAQWTARFTAFINGMRTQQPTFGNVWPMRAETKVIIGELFRGGTNGGSPGVGSPTDDRNAEIRAYLDGGDPWITVASSHSFRSTDNLHISARDLDDFGLRRYYEAAMRLPIVQPPARLSAAAAPVTNLNLAVETGFYRHDSAATNTPVAVAGVVTVITNGIYIQQTWHATGGGSNLSYSRISTSGVWGSWEQLATAAVRVSGTEITISGKLKQFTGSATIPAATTSVITIGGTMVGATEYVPNVNVAAIGASVFSPPLVTGRTPTTFTVQNLHATQAMNITWSVMGFVV